MKLMNLSGLMGDEPKEPTPVFTKFLRSEGLWDDAHRTPQDYAHVIVLDGHYFDGDNPVLFLAFEYTASGCTVIFRGRLE